jgi:hypothetical protein
MPGLNLRGGAGFGAAASSGGGLYPIPAGASSTGPSTAAAAAYGPVTGAATGPRTAAVGAGCAGLLAAALLLYLWWSLPR